MKTDSLLRPQDLSDFLSHQLAQKDAAFYVVDLAKVEGQLALWRQLLPNVEPFYAVKCNPDPVILSLLHHLGAGFDCASQGEIALAQSLGVLPNKIIFANPCKHPHQILFAQAQGVHTYTFDCVEELEKIYALDANARLVLRLKTDDSHSLCQFSTKFGASMQEVPAILERAKALNAALIGVSFHVGSGCKDVIAYSQALADSKEVFDRAQALGFQLTLLDIGGGFPSFPDAKINFEAIAQTIRTALAKYFSQYPNLQIIGEPGRFMVGNSHTLYVNVMSKKQKIDEQTAKKRFFYYINEGVYGSFNCLFFDHYELNIQPLNRTAGDLYHTTLFGQTCDSMDKIGEGLQMPELFVGDWLRVENFGAYTRAPASAFNGFPVPQRYYVQGKTADFLQK